MKKNKTIIIIIENLREKQRWKTFLANYRRGGNAGKRRLALKLALGLALGLAPH
jgi:hypothetical protein